MGQRANYIIKTDKNLAIHYNHWRANYIVSDLYLGEKRFLNFVEECQLDETLINDPWMEGCVIIDKVSRQLYFWAWEFPRETSVIEYYMEQLAKKWSGWQITQLKNRMYDAEVVLGIEYVALQELSELNIRSKDRVINDKVEELETAVVIIKNDDDLFVTITGNLTIDAVISYGSEIIPLLKNKQRSTLPKEGDASTYQCVVIDVINKKLFINESSFGLWEQSKDFWKGFSFTMGDVGYIGTLRLAGIETSDLTMQHDKVIEEFEGVVNLSDVFDPFEMAKKLKEDYTDIQINPDFFDNVKPRRTMLEKIKLQVNKMLGRT